MIRYKGAWWVDSPAAIATLAAAGFNVHLIPYLSARQVEDCLAAVPQWHYVIILLTGEPAQKAAQVKRLVDRPVFGYVIADEPNVGGTLLSKEIQVAFYRACKAIDPFKMIFASYHFEPTGPSFPSFVVTTPGQAWDYVMLNYYPWAWGITNAQAKANLATALASVRGFFAPETLLVAIQQAAGCTKETTQLPKPIPGLLQAQHDMWAASGLNVIAVVYYGWGTNPEDWNLRAPSLLAEAAAVNL